MSDIFISYATADRHHAEMLAQRFTGYGWSTFWDRTIRIGATWRETIGKELGEARCVVVLWSKASIESSWVQEEADDAKHRRILVPVLIEDIRPPIGFRSIQAGNLANWNGTESAAAFRKLITDITGLIGPPHRVAGDGASPPVAEIESEAEPPRAESKTEATGAGEARPHAKREERAWPPARPDPAKASKWPSSWTASRLAWVVAVPVAAIAAAIAIGLLKPSDAIQSSSVPSDAIQSPSVPSDAPQTRKTVQICVGNGGGQSCRGPGVVSYTCAEYRAMGGDSLQAYAMLNQIVCGSKAGATDKNVQQNYSRGGGECGWTSLTITCLE